MLPHDTHPEAHRLQLRLYRAMSLERKYESTAQLCSAVLSVGVSGIQHHHPEYSNAEAFRALRRLLFGEAAACYTSEREDEQRVLDVTPFLTRVVEALDAAGIPFMVVGSFASSIHGIPRYTRDLDLVIDPAPAALEALLRLLSDEDCYLDRNVARAEFRRRGQFNIIDASSPWKADLIYRKNRAFDRAEFERRMPITLVGISLFVATAEDTLLAKLEWAKLGQSERQLEDVRGIVATRAEGLDRAYVERWLDALGVRELWERVERGSLGYTGG